MGRLVGARSVLERPPWPAVGSDGQEERPESVLSPITYPSCHPPAPLRPPLGWVTATSMLCSPGLHPGSATVCLSSGPHILAPKGRRGLVSWP